MTASPVAASTVSFNPETRLLVDGQLRESAGGKTADNLNPATEEVLGVAADASAQDMDEAIAAARRAFDTTDWSTNHEFRQRCLMQLHDALQEEKEDMRAELIAEVGATVGMTYIAQLEWPLADAVRYPAELISTFEWERMLAQDAKMGTPYNRVVVKEAMGVVGAITPWNFPFEIISNKVGQILATGNTMVLKAAIETPWSALRWGRIIAEKTDIPAGVVNIITASDNDVAQRVVTDPRVDMISFTGSTAVGQLIQRLSGDTMKRNMLELGGKSAYLILDDADMNMALPGCLGALMHSGQGCALATRMLVPRSHYDQAVEVATATFGSLTVGDPADPNTFCGPLISAKQRERVLNYIDIAKRDGGRVTVGGGVPEGLDRGYFVSPTVVADVAPDHTIFQEEVFGPVLSITPYDGGDDGAVEIANNSTYGLAGGIHGSTERAMAVARRIRTGSLMINSGLFYGADAPFGGYKMSGIGRQNGIEGFEQHLQTKTIGYPPMTDILSGIRVVEIAAWTFVPAAGAVLADWGADVIKIEHPETGDPQRGLISSGIVTGAGGVNHFVEQPNRGKRSVAIDTRTPDGLELLLKIVETADVFLTNLLPDSRERMGIDLEQIRARNPKIIYARGHGYGTKGELAAQGGFDLAAYWSRGGIADAYSSGGGAYPPIQRPAFGDSYGGLCIAAGIAGALLKRERTGESSVVDVSLLNAAIWQLGPDVVGAGVTGQDIPKFNLEEMPNPAVSIYKTKDDRFIAFVLLQADRFWSDFCTRLGRPDLITDERYANAPVRFQNRADCIVELRKAFGSEDLAHWEKAFAGFDGVWDVMRTAHEVHSDPQAIANGYLPKATNTSDIEFALAASPVQFDETPLDLTRAPEHGEHTDALLAELGFSGEEIIDFKINAVVL